MVNRYSAEGRQAPRSYRGIIVAVVFLLILAAIASNSEHNSPAPSAASKQQQVNAATNPHDAVLTIITNPKANVQIAWVGDALNVIYNLEPWQALNWTTRITFIDYARQIPPAIFKRFSAINTVEITGNGKLVDLRGNSKIDKLMYIKFTRANNTTINWGEVLNDNIPKIADAFWQHPSLD